MLEKFDRVFNQRYLGIRWKLALPLIGTFVVLAAVLSPLTNWLVTSRIEQEADRRLSEVADSVGGLLENSEYLARSSAILLAHQPEVTQGFRDLNSAKELLLTEQQTLRLQELSLYQADYKPGDTLYYYGGPPITRRLQASQNGQKLRDELILRAIQTGSPSSGVVITPQNSQIIGAAPVYDPDNKKLLGVVLAGFYLDQEYIDNISQVLDTEVAIVKDNAIIISTIDPQSGYEHLIKQGWLNHTDTPPAENIRFGSGRDYRLLGYPLVIAGENQGSVLVAQPIDELLQVKTNIQAVFYIVIGIFALAALWFWVAAFIAFTKPLGQLTDATTRISKGEINQRVETKFFMFKDEITILSENFNAMTADLNNLYASLEERVQQRTLELVEERNKLEVALKELAEARDTAVAANKSKSEFISIVSHELKIPMTSIKGYSDLMLAGATGPLNDNQTNFLKTIRSNVGRMATLVSDLADISRIETGNLRLEPRDIAVKEVLDEIVNLSRNQIEQKKQTISTDFPAELPKAWCDRNRLSQILTNLVSNANKYTPEGGAIVVRACQIEENGKPMVRIQVEDNGLGMTAEDQQKLFSKFFRSADEKVREAPGTGLGLSITKNLIELQGGRIWFESEYRKGTSFFFTVPILTEEDQ